jgi:hypothetical protein
LHNLICILAKFCTEKTLLLKDYCPLWLQTKNSSEKHWLTGDSASKENSDYGKKIKIKIMMMMIWLLLLNIA